MARRRLSGNHGPNPNRCASTRPEGTRTISPADVSVRSSRCCPSGEMAAVANAPLGSRRSLPVSTDASQSARGPRASTSVSPSGENASATPSKLRIALPCSSVTAVEPEKSRPFLKCSVTRARRGAAWAHNAWSARLVKSTRPPASATLILGRPGIRKEYASRCPSADHGDGPADAAWSSNAIVRPDASRSSIRRLPCCVRSMTASTAPSGDQAPLTALRPLGRPAKRCGADLAPIRAL
jgi:hypothetical protein